MSEVALLWLWLDTAELHTMDDVHTYCYVVQYRLLSWYIRTYLHTCYTHEVQNQRLHHCMDRDTDS